MANKVMDELRAKEERASQNACLAMEDALEAFRHYYRWLDKAHAGALNDQGCSAEKRLKQAVLVLERIDQLLAHERSLGKSLELDYDLYQREPDKAVAEWRARVQGDEGGAVTESRDWEWLELLSEQFYWVAFRARSAMRHLPGLEKFEAQGVRNTRNKLIEHPEGSDSRVFNGGFAFGSERGPVLAALRTDQQPDAWPDAGLFPNVREFASNLMASVATSGAGPPPHQASA